VPDQYPLPLIQELVDKVQDAWLFTKMDVHAGYNNIRFREGDEEKAAFKMNMGLFEPTVMPFGLCNALAVFQRMMNTQFMDIIATCYDFGHGLFFTYLSLTSSSFSRAGLSLLQYDITSTSFLHHFDS